MNVVSRSYGHIPNERFFGEAESLLINAGLSYHKQTVNRDDRSFITDFIITDRELFSVKNTEDVILPMLRFKNSYDGSEKTSGHFGFYRKICSNGLHVSRSEIAFSIRHTKSCTELVMPKLNQLFEKFLDNEYYEIVSKFDRMKTVEIMDTKVFVKTVLEKMKLFRYDCSDKNSDPSKKSREVLEILGHEALLLDQKPNLWLGYNAFNSVLHNTLKRGFSQQERLDRKLFETIYEMG